jgi:hypothetical protein
MSCPQLRTCHRINHCCCSVAAAVALLITLVVLLPLLVAAAVAIAGKPIVVNTIPIVFYCRCCSCVKITVVAFVRPVLLPRLLLLFVHLLLPLLLQL